MPPKLPNSMPWQIYQAYLSGPHALFKLFEEAFGRHALYGPPDPDQQQRTINALSEQVGQLKAQNERLKAEANELRGHNFQLQRRNAELEALATRDSHNSSRSPSTDPAWAKRTKSLRQPSGKRPGGQSGIVGRRSDSRHVPTVSSSIARGSAGVVTPKWMRSASSRSIAGRW